MVKGLVGFAGVFVLFLFGMKIIGFLLGGVVAIVLKLVWFAFLGWLIFTAIRVMSPSTADRIRDTFRSKPSTAE
jgi:hypothetical protein